jgi:uncharacterized protein (DUF1015 family)
LTRIRPFRAYRYTSQAGHPAHLVTQPYDKITPEMQARYLALSPYNLVRIILGARNPGDSAADNAYTRAAGYWRAWRQQGLVAPDAEAAFYPYFQEFRHPDTGEHLTRKGFIGLGPVEDYSAGIVFRHEQTLSGPKRDRLELLRHTRAHFELIFLLYSDPEGVIDALLEEAASAAPLIEVTDEYQAVHRLWRLSEPAAIAEIERRMASSKLLIADGHHRYETALQFRREHPELEAARWVMAAFVNMHSPGLRILATHRLLRGLADRAGRRLLEAARSRFRVERLGSLADLSGRWAARAPEQVRIGVALRDPQELYLIEADRAAGRLDVTFLHEELLERMLGIGEEDVREERFVTYVRGLEAAVEEVRSGGAEIAFLLEPVTVEQVAAVAFAGGVMPQKSTDFYPKLLSGLTIYSLEETAP